MITRRLLLLAPTPLFAHSINHFDLLIGHAWAIPAKGETRVMFPLGLKAGEDELLSIETDNAYEFHLYKGEEKKAFPLKFSSKAPVAMQNNGVHLRLKYLKQGIFKGDKFMLKAMFRKHGVVNIEVWVEDKPYG